MGNVAGRFYRVIEVLPVMPYYSAGNDAHRDFYYIKVFARFPVRLMVSAI